MAQKNVKGVETQVLEAGEEEEDFKFKSNHDMAFDLFRTGISRSSSVYKGKTTFAYEIDNF